MSSAPSNLDYDPPPDPKASYRLYQAGLSAVLLAGAWFIFQTGGDVSLRTLLGLAILGLASLPALRWAKLQRRWFPVFEIGCLIYIAFYAIPLLTNHGELAAYPDAVVVQSAFYVAVFLTTANFAFEFTNRPLRTPPWAAVSLLPEGLARYVPLGQILNTGYLYLTIATDVIPIEIVGTLRALFFGVGTLATFVLARQAGLGLLSQRQLTLFAINLAAQVVFLFAQLYLVGGLSLLALALIAYASARRRVPWLVCGIVLPFIALLHMGKPAMRNIYWHGGEPLPGITGLPFFFEQWVDLSIEEIGRSGTGEEIAPSNLFERASLIQMLCLSVDRIPSVKPFLEGETYVAVPAQVVPRFLWPDKPSGLKANVHLALYFGLVNSDTALNVSIAFGMLAEAYANFGLTGIIALGFLMGFIGRRISLMAENASMFSCLGIMMILLAAWSFQVEFVLATWLGSLLQAMIVCVGVPLAYRKFTTS